MSTFHSIEESIPENYKELNEVRDKIEKHYKDMQDFEFTIQEGKLYLLQWINGKNAGKTWVKIVVDLYNEGIIDKNQALLLVDPNSINQLLHRQIDPKSKKIVLSKGLNASPGVGCGTIIFTADDAEVKSKDGKMDQLN